MNIDLKNIKFFSTEEEREEIEARELAKDSDFGDPKSELAVMHNATKWGIYFFACVTLLSTAALIYRVTFPHVAELLGTASAQVSMLVLAFGVSLAIEIMLRGNWEPFTKKVFITGQFDIVLFSLGVIFTGIILYGAITGMEIIADTNAGDPKIESVIASSDATNATIAANKKEIETLLAGKGKGVFSWQGKPTPHAKNRVNELEKQNTAALSSLAILSQTTAAANAAKITTFNDKTAKAVHYLSILAIGAEIIKIIIFVFWGYRSWQLKNFVPKPSSTQPVQQPQPQTPPEQPVKQVAASPLLPLSGTGGSKTDNVAKTVWKTKLTNRGPYKDKFKQHFLHGKYSYEKLVKYWQDNEDALFEACMELGFEYEEAPIPKKEDFLQTA